MSEHTTTDETPVVGASGSIGILPNGFFAKILNGPPHDANSAETPVSQDSSEHH
jgi:hypothetical protein